MGNPRSRACGSLCERASYCSITDFLDKPEAPSALHVVSGISLIMIRSECGASCALEYFGALVLINVRLAL